MIDRYTKVCLTVIAVSLAVIGLRELPMVGPAHADPDNALEPVGTYQLAYNTHAVAVLNTRSGFVSRCYWKGDELVCRQPQSSDQHRPLNLPKR